MYKIITDNTADLPDSYVAEHDLGIMNLHYTIDGQTYESENALDKKTFYNMMRQGLMTQTTQPSPGAVKELMLEALETHDGVLCIALSSGISGTYNSASLARDMVLEEKPDAKIYVIDSTSASLGEGLLVHKAVKNRDAGMSLEDNAKWVEDNKLHIVAAFTVDDLMFLYRGGRLKKAAAVVGTIINLKPVLHIDDLGKLVNIFNVRGRKKAIGALADYMVKHMGQWDNSDVFISHGDCEEDALTLAAKIKEMTGIEVSIINYVGSTIGSHSGPGTLALFFMGDER